MTEKKTYCFRWRCYRVQKAPPYKAAAIGAGDMRSITRSKAFNAAFHCALEILKNECPELTVSNVPKMTRSDRLYHVECQTKDFIYHVFMEEKTNE